MGSKIVVRHYKYKNIAIAMAILLLMILSIATACSSDSGKKAEPVAKTESSAEKVTKPKKEESSSVPFKAEDLTKNYKYINVKNESGLGSGNLVVINSTFKYAGGIPSDLDGVYGYLFDKSGAQIGFTSSTEVKGRKDMLTAFNEMLCGFYEKTKLKTIMVSDMYTGEEPQVDEQGEEDSSENEEENTAETVQPSCYEHESGLALDLQLYLAEEGTYPEFDGTGKYTWLGENCWQYGFIQRYTEEKASVTGMSAVPKHFRYVGKPHAEIMHNESLSLEEYIEFVKHYNFENPYSFESKDGNCYVLYYTVMSSEKSTNCPIPLTKNSEEYEYEISGDNMGGYVVCVKMVSSDGESDTEQTESDNGSDDSQASDESSEAAADESSSQAAQG